MRPPIPFPAKHVSGLWDAIPVSPMDIEISVYCTLAVMALKRISQKVKTKSQIKWLMQVLFLNNLFCHSKRNLFICGQYCNSTSSWILCETDHRTFIILIWLDQWLTFAAETNSDSVLTYWCCVLRISWRWSLQMSKYHPFFPGVLTHDA